MNELDTYAQFTDTEPTQDTISLLLDEMSHIKVSEVHRQELLIE